MDKICDTCFHRDKGFRAAPCTNCDEVYNKWVAIDFLANVDDRPFVEHGAEVMSSVVNQLEKIKPAPYNPLNKQVSGSHYKGLKIQPIEYLHANNIPFAEGCAIKYLTRWRDKGGVSDLEKAKHFIELLIELETRK